MRRNTREYDTDLRRDNEIINLDGVVYQGRTVLREGPEKFAPLERWAKGVAETLGEPVTWRAFDKGEIAARGTVRPGHCSQNRRAL